MRQLLVAGNWKLNGSLAMVQSLLAGIVGDLESVTAEVAVCPPYVYLPLAQQMLKGGRVALGAQNVCNEDVGAFTGEVSVPMLKEFDCRYVIVGHSERRSLYGETDAITADKFTAVCKGTLVPILCVGESLQERKEGRAERVVARQLNAVIQHKHAVLDTFVIAYEPVWAIGTGKTATSEQAQEMHQFIREHISQHDASIAQQTRILYGGSVKGSNAHELFSQPDIDGGLIGGASLTAGDFLAICDAG